MAMKECSSQATTTLLANGDLNADGGVIFDGSLKLVGDDSANVDLDINDDHKVNHHQEVNNKLIVNGGLKVSDGPDVDNGSGPSALLHRTLHEDPCTAASAEGCYLTLSSGRRILDACAGAAVSLIGHGNPQVRDAVFDQMSKLSYVHSLAYTTSAAEQLAAVLLSDDGSCSPGGKNRHGFEKVYLVGSGSEATDSALKLARQFHVENGEPQRRHFVARQQAYHGNTVGAMSVGSFRARRAPYEGCLTLENVSFVSAAYAYRGMRDGELEEQYAERLVAELDDEFRRVGPRNVCAFIAETVGGATAGCITAPRGYFERVARLCERYGILLILDEVMCGRGRTGSAYAFEQEGEGVRPDIVTLGKGLGAGYAPIAAVMIGGKVVDVLRRGSGSFMHGHTYQSHPVGCAAALAVQKIMREGDLVARGAEKGDLLGRLLRSTFAGSKHVGEVRGRGMFWAVEFVEDRVTKEPFDPRLDFGNKVQQTAFGMGLAVYPGRGTADGMRGDHVLLAPPLTMSEEELRLTVGILRQAYEVVVERVASSQG